MEAAQKKRLLLTCEQCSKRWDASYSPCCRAPLVEDFERCAKCKKRLPERERFACPDCAAVATPVEWDVVLGEPVAADERNDLPFGLAYLLSELDQLGTDSRGRVTLRELRAWFTEVGIVDPFERALVRRWATAIWQTRSFERERITEQLDNEAAQQRAMGRPGHQ